ncbi:MAG: ABC transporter substrate-binding protein, partial [Frankia sp.]
MTAGCGQSSSSAAGSDGSTANCAVPGISSAGVRLGLLWPNSGVAAATITDFRGGIDARIDLQNSQGGVNGRPISYDWADDASAPIQNLAGARNLVETKKDFALIEATTSETGSAAYLSAHGIPVVGLGSSDVWSRYPNMFTWASLNTQTATTSAWGDFARQEGGTKAVVLGYTAIPYSRQLSESMAASMRTAGISVVYQNLNVSTANLPALAATIAQSGANVVTGAFPPQLWSQLVPALSRDGAHIDVP